MSALFSHYFCRQLAAPDREFREMCYAPSRGDSLARAHDKTLVEEGLRPSLESVKRDATRVTPRLATALRYLEKNLFESLINIDSLARVCDRSPRWLRRQFRRELGCSSHDYLTRLRLEAARRLLETGCFEVWEVARHTGYRSADSLYRAYVRHYNEAPSSTHKKGGQASSDEDSKASLLRLTERRAFSVLQSWLNHATDKDFAEVLQGGYQIDALALVRGLLEESRTGCRENRPQGVVLARLALDALWDACDQLRQSEYMSLKVESLAHLGHAACLAGDWKDAEQAFSEAHLLVDEAKVEPGVKGTLYAFYGVFRRHQNRLDEASELLEGACAIQRQAGDSTVLAQTLLAFGRVLEQQGAVAAGIARYLEAVSLSERQTDPYLKLAAHNHLANAYGLIGELDLAEAELEHAR